MEDKDILLMLVMIQSLSVLLISKSLRVTNQENKMHKVLTPRAVFMCVLFVEKPVTKLKFITRSMDFHLLFREISILLQLILLHPLRKILNMWKTLQCVFILKLLLQL